MVAYKNNPSINVLCQTLEAESSFDHREEIMICLVSAESINLFRHENEEKRYKFEEDGDTFVCRTALAILGLLITLEVFRFSI